MPLFHTVQEFVQDPNSNKVLFVHTMNCSLDHSHGYSTYYSDFCSNVPSTRIPKVVGMTKSVYTTLESACKYKNDTLSKLSQGSEKNNPIQSYSENNSLFLKDILGFVSRRR